MEFNQAIIKIIEAFIEAWNNQNYAVVSEKLVQNVIVSSEAIDIENMQVPAIEVIGIENAINYWKEMKAGFNVSIEKYEIIVAGRNSQVLCHYKGMDLHMISEVHINEYGKATKIASSIKQPQ